ncbi:hypothetical protein HAX54_032580 [Datura stramonium]|uniref:Uncharacterized protein n=1 Tax=Datura stramonium TaxID=4076 RepID=A0ABS8VD21_DATST|nr:hypothetical protein [Datura stramonium]
MAPATELLCFSIIQKFAESIPPTVASEISVYRSNLTLATICGCAGVNSTGAWWKLVAISSWFCRFGLCASSIAIVYLRLKLGESMIVLSMVTNPGSLANHEDHRSPAKQVATHCSCPKNAA